MSPSDPNAVLKNLEVYEEYAKECTKLNINSTMYIDHWDVGYDADPHIMIAYGQYSQSLAAYRRDADRLAAAKLVQIAKEKAHKEAMAVKYGSRDLETIG